MKLCVITKDYGQRSNQLHTFAYMCALAIEHKFIVLNLPFQKYEKDYAFYYKPQSEIQPIVCPFFSRNIFFRYFKRKLHKFSNSSVLNNKLSLFEYSDSEFFDLDKSNHRNAILSRNVLFNNQWLYESQSLFPKHSDAIRSIFQPREDVQLQVVNLVKQQRNDASLLFGIHIRLGDYENFANGKFYFDIEDYFNIMQEIKSQFVGRKIKFIVCCNEPQKITFNKNISYVLAAQNAVFEQCLLSHCDYILGPPSTFSLWASFMGKVPLYFLKNRTDYPNIADFKLLDTPSVLPAFKIINP